MTIDESELERGLETALRIRIWNECKERGMRDEDAYRRINAEVEGIKTRARTASSTREGL